MKNKLMSSMSEDDNNLEHLGWINDHLDDELSEENERKRISKLADHLLTSQSTAMKERIYYNKSGFFM